MWSWKSRIAIIAKDLPEWTALNLICQFLWTSKMGSSCTHQNRTSYFRKGWSSDRRSFSLHPWCTPIIFLPSFWPHLPWNVNLLFFLVPPIYELSVMLCFRLGSNESKWAWLAKSTAFLIGKQVEKRSQGLILISMLRRLNFEFSIFFSADLLPKFYSFQIKPSFPPIFLSI